MSWLVTSIANSLKLDDTELYSTTTTTTANDETSNPSDHQSTTPLGVKNDLSEFSQTLTRQLYGVASFLAPPPPSQPPLPSNENSSDLAAITGIRNDFSEFSGRFRSGISKISSNKAVSEFTKIASSLIRFGSDEDLSIEEYEERGVVGVSEEVVAFVRDVSMYPRTWIDFPLPDDDDDVEGFELSDAQEEHALAVERLAPELAALRTELCLGYMNEGSFWKIYFVLVHPKLSKEAAEILSTPQIIRARELLTQEHHKSDLFNSKSTNTFIDTTNSSHEDHSSFPVNDPSEYIPVEISYVDPVSSTSADLEVDKHVITTTEIPITDLEVIEVSKKLIDREGPTTSNTNPNDSDDKEVAEGVSNRQLEREVRHTSKSIDHKEEDEDDDWLNEESTEGSSFKGTSYQIGNDDDVSFSDLEEDDDVPT